MLKAFVIDKILDSTELNDLIDEDFCPVLLGQGMFGSVFKNGMPASIQIEGLGIYDVAYKIVSAEGQRVMSVEKSLVFVNDPRGEFICGALATKAFIDGVTPHVCMLLTMNSCDPDQVTILMEYVGNTATWIRTVFDSNAMQMIEEVVPVRDAGDFLMHTLQKAPDTLESVINTLMLQVYHTCLILFDMGVYIADLHLGNVLVKSLDEGVPYWRGEAINHDYFAYGYGGKKYYVENKGWIAKIADYGMFSATHGSKTYYAHPAAYRAEIELKRGFALYSFASMLGNDFMRTELVRNIEGLTEGAGFSLYSAPFTRKDIKAVLDLVVKRFPNKIPRSGASVLEINV